MILQPKASVMEKVDSSAGLTVSVHVSQPSHYNHTHSPVPTIKPLWALVSSSTGQGEDEAHVST